MNVGLLNAGVDGLYYLLCASVMPFREVYLSLTKAEHKFRYRLVATQLGITSGIVFGFFIMYGLINKIFGLNLLLAKHSQGSDSLFYYFLPILISLGFLLLLLSLVELAAFFIKKG